MSETETAGILAAIEDRSVVAKTALIVHTEGRDVRLLLDALRDVVELHKQADAPYAWMCAVCGDEGQTMDCTYPCDTLRILARGLGLESL